MRLTVILAITLAPAIFAKECNLPYNDTCQILAKQPFPRPQYVCSEQGVLPPENEVLIPRTPCTTQDPEQSDDNQFGFGNSCGIGCMNEPACISWSWDFYNSECKHYRKTLRQMNFTRTPNGPYTIRYFNRNCLYKDCSKPNLVADGSFETASPVLDDGSKKPDTWSYTTELQDPTVNYINCSSTTQSFIGKKAFQCYYGNKYYRNSRDTVTLTQYPSAIRPNTTYSLLFRYILSQANYEFMTLQNGHAFACKYYGDGVLLRSELLCLNDFYAECPLSGHYQREFIANWTSGPGSVGTHSISVSCTSIEAEFLYILDDFEIREV